MRVTEPRLTMSAANPWEASALDTNEGGSSTRVERSASLRRKAGRLALSSVMRTLEKEGKKEADVLAPRPTRAAAAVAADFMMKLTDYKNNEFS